MVCVLRFHGKTISCKIVKKVDEEMYSFEDISFSAITLDPVYYIDI